VNSDETKEISTGSEAKDASVSLIAKAKASKMMVKSEPEEIS